MPNIKGHDTSDYRRADIEFYDQLGPLTRAVIREESPREIDVREMMIEYAPRWVGGYLANDQGYANWLRSAIRDKMRNNPREAVPLVPDRSRLQERRRALLERRTP